MFHRWEKGAVRGYSKSNIRIEADHLLACGGPVDDPQLVNGMASYGNVNETALDDTRHTLCIAGGTEEGDGESLYFRLYSD